MPCEIMNSYYGSDKDSMSLYKSIKGDLPSSDNLI